MDELVQHVAEKTGLSLELAHKAVEVIVNFLNREADPALVQEFIAKLPGGDAMLRQHGEGGSSSLLGSLAGLFGGSGAMSAFNELSEIGLNVGQVQAVAKEVIAYANENVGTDLTDRVVASIPGLSRIL